MADTGRCQALSYSGKALAFSAAATVLVLSRPASLMAAIQDGMAGFCQHSMPWECGHHQFVLVGAQIKG